MASNKYIANIKFRYAMLSMRKLSTDCKVELLFSKTRGDGPRKENL